MCGKAELGRHREISLFDVSCRLFERTHLYSLCMSINMCPQLVVSPHMLPMVRLPLYSASRAPGRSYNFSTLSKHRAFHAAMGLAKVALQAFPQWFGSKVLISKVARGILSRLNSSAYSLQHVWCSIASCKMKEGFHQ